MADTPRRNGRQMLNLPDGHPVPPPPRPRGRKLAVACYSAAVRRLATLRCSQDVQTRDDVHQAHSSKSTIQCLPYDVLSEIITQWHRAEPSPSDSRHAPVPFNASRVCKSWRIAALATHPLWTRTHFSFREMLDNAAWLEYHACFAARAGALGYEVQLSSNVADVPHGNLVWEHFRGNILVKARVIDLDISEPTADPSILAGLEFPLLHTLRVRFSDVAWITDYPVINLSMRSPNIRHIQLDKPFINIDDELGEANPLRFATSLAIGRKVYAVDRLRTLATMCTALTDFTLTAEGFYDAPCEPFVWDRLTVLRITLEYFRDGDLIPFHMQLPNLTTLEVKDNRHHWPVWRHFVEHSCPALAHLVVVRNHMDYSGDLVDGIGMLAQLRTLTFRDGSLNEELLGRLIMPRPAVGFEMPFAGLRAVHFEATVPLDRFRYKLVLLVLQKRYMYLNKIGVSARFDFTCSSKRRLADAEENAVRARGEEMVRRYNEDAWRKFQTVQ